MPTVQISATISADTKSTLDELARVTGRSRQAIVEDAILREAQALYDIPPEFLVPAQITLSGEDARRLLDMIDHPRKPGPALKKLMSGR